MRGILGVIPFVALAFLSWGVYGPVLHAGQFSSDLEPSSLKPFICVGIAYFLIATIVPAFLLRTKGEPGVWSKEGVSWSLLAGAAGAFGALGIVLAFKFKGDPVYVMPLVFGCAPVVNTIMSMVMGRTFKQASLYFFIGILIVAIGAAGVMFFKPLGAVGFSENSQGVITVTSVDGKETKFDSTEQLQKNSPDNFASYKTWRSKRPSGTEYFMVLISIAMAAFCWGIYGPVLHRGQALMEGSKLRPFACVGLSYFVVAVLIPIPLLFTGMADPAGWHFFSGSFFSLLAGSMGAVGALGIIYAFNFGGKPIYVMPLVFGMAPVVNTITSISISGLFDQVPMVFYLSLMLVISGAVMVLLFAPSAKLAKENKRESSRADEPHAREAEGKSEPEDPTVVPTETKSGAESTAQSEGTAN